MPFKINIADNSDKKHQGRTWKLETEGEFLAGKSIGDKFDGKELKKELEGYELEITGGSDMAGFPMFKNAEGIGLKRVLLKKGWGMKDPQEGLRLKKTVRGKLISNTTVQVNVKVLKQGSKKLAEIFAEQNKAKEQTKEESKTEEVVKVEKEVSKENAKAKIEEKLVEVAAVA